MSYSYSTPLSYGNQVPLSYNEQPQEEVVVKEKTSAAPVTLAGCGLGLITGSLIGINKKPYIKNGVPTDTFTKTVYDKYVNKIADMAEKTSFSQYQEVIQKIDKVKNLDELKTLINNNPEVSKEIETTLSGKTTTDYLNTLRESNLTTAKKVIKEKLEAANNIRYEGIKTQITSCWDAEKKAFVKPDSMDEKMFKAIKKSANKVKSACTAKTAGIVAVIGGIVGFIGHKIINHKKETSQQ